MNMSKKTEKVVAKPKSILSVNLPDGSSLECKAAGIEEWDRYIAKRRQGQLPIGRRELVASCCVSHSGEECHKLLKKFAALPKKIADEIEDLAGAAESPEIDFDEDTASVSTPDGDLIVIRAPTLSEWEEIENTTAAPLDFSKTIRDFTVKLSDESAQSHFAKWPALPVQLLDGAAQLAGAGLEVQIKKD